LSTYIAVIYISFMVFLVTIWILDVTFLPKMLERAARWPRPAAPSRARWPKTFRSRQPNPNRVLHRDGGARLGTASSRESWTPGRSRTAEHSFIMLVIALFAFLFI